MRRRRWRQACRICSAPHGPILVVIDVDPDTTPLPNSADLRALGWVVTRDACGEVVRSMFGTPRRIAPEALRGLVNRWRRLQVLRVEEARVAVQWRAAPLSPPVSEQCRLFVQQLVSDWPDQYAAPALRRRRMNAILQALVGYGGSFLLRDSTDALLDSVSTVLLVMGCWSLLSGIQVSRVLGLVRRLADSTTGATRGDVPVDLG